MVDDLPGLEPAASACLDRTRSAVLNVLVVVGAGIAVSGWVLGRHDRGAFVWDPVLARRISVVILLLLLVASQLVLRIGSGRSALRDPSRRAVRFVRAHLAAAIVGGLAVPLGFAYGWAIQPRLEAVAPFWVVALASGFLAIPRHHELADFDTPIPDAPTGEAA
jgi:hypothetical protein